MAHTHTLLYTNTAQTPRYESHGFPSQIFTKAQPLYPGKVYGSHLFSMR